MTRSELAKELREWEASLPQVIPEMPQRLREHLIDIVILLEDDSKLHEACDLLESLKEFPERTRLQRDARRYRLLKEIVEYENLNAIAWCVDSSNDAQKAELFPSWAKKVRDGWYPTLDAALDAWIEEHPDVG